MFSKKLLEIYSKFNGCIEVVEDMGGRRRVVTKTQDGQKLSQSGYLVERLWEKGFENCTLKIENCRQVLILGLGAGSVVCVIKNRWSDSTIDAVEVDPVMVEVGRKFFGQLF